MTASLLLCDADKNKLRTFMFDQKCMTRDSEKLQRNSLRLEHSKQILAYGKILIKSLKHKDNCRLTSRDIKI